MISVERFQNCKEMLFLLGLHDVYARMSGFLIYLSTGLCKVKKSTKRDNWMWVGFRSHLEEKTWKMVPK